MLAAAHSAGLVLDTLGVLTPTKDLGQRRAEVDDDAGHRRTWIDAAMPIHWIALALWRRSSAWTSSAALASRRSNSPSD